MSPVAVESILRGPGPEAQFQDPKPNRMALKVPNRMQTLRGSGLTINTMRFSNNLITRRPVGVLAREEGETLSPPPQQLPHLRIITQIIISIPSMVARANKAISWVVVVVETIISTTILTTTIQVKVVVGADLITRCNI
jgi:hypothetical protein